MAFQEYRYTVSLKYIHNSKEINIDNELINFIYIDSDYLGKKAFPIVYLGIRLPVNIYNDMIENIKNDTVVFTLNKYTTDSKEESSPNIESQIIKGQFLYFFNTTDPNYNQDIEDEVTEDGQNTSGYKSVKIGLASLDILNYCKNIINDVVSGNMSSIIHDYIGSGNNKVIMQPLDNNKYMNELIIPPLPTLNKLLEYLNSVSSFYNTSYRFFIDLNMTTYLLSNNGIAVETKDSKYSSIIIKVSNSTEIEMYKEPGVEIDIENKCYNLYLNAQNTSTTINVYKDKEVNKIITIDSSGNIKKSLLSNSNNSKGTRTNIFRTFNDNVNEINEIENLIESNKVMMNITKEGVDCSIITPEKSINITNYKTYREYDGKYILAGKQEIFVRNDSSNFTCSTILKLLKVKS